MTTKEIYQEIQGLIDLLKKEGKGKILPLSRPKLRELKVGKIFRFFHH